MGQPAWRKLEREIQKEKAKGARPLTLYAEVTQELEFYFECFCYGTVQYQRGH
jgi:hypothetical protein